MSRSEVAHVALTALDHIGILASAGAAFVLWLPGDTTGKSQSYKIVRKLLGGEMSLATAFTIVAVLHVVALFIRWSPVRIAAHGFAFLWWAFLTFALTLANPIGLSLPVCGGIAIVYRALLRIELLGRK